MNVKKLTVILIGCVTFAPILLGAVVHWGTLDGLIGNIFASLDFSDTVYAPGYSDSAFRKVRIGMTKEEVRELLGEPIDRYTNPYESGENWSDWKPTIGWEYSYSPGDTNYRMRIVLIKDGRVVEKRAEFYLD